LELQAKMRLHETTANNPNKADIAFASANALRRTKIYLGY
jgi:hypothetical protein